MTGDHFQEPHHCELLTAPGKRMSRHGGAVRILSYELLGFKNRLTATFMKSWITVISCPWAPHAGYHEKSMEDSFLNNNPEEVGTLGHLLAAASFLLAAAQE